MQFQKNQMVFALLLGNKSCCQVRYLPQGNLLHQDHYQKPIP